MYTHSILDSSIVPLSEQVLVSVDFATERLIEVVAGERFRPLKRLLCFLVAFCIIIQFPQIVYRMRNDVGLPLYALSHVYGCLKTKKKKKKTSLAKVATRWVVLILTNKSCSPSSNFPKLCKALPFK